MKTLLALCFFCSVANAQQTWTYADGNADFTAEIVLPQALPQNGTTDVNPTSVAFGMGLTGYVSPYGFVYGPGFVDATPAVYQFMTVNGAITAFDIALNLVTPGGNTQTAMTLNLSSFAGDSYTQVTYGWECSFSPCNPVSATSAPGVWVDPPTTVPEIAPSAEALVLLLGALAMARSRSPR